MSDRPIRVLLIEDDPEYTVLVQTLLKVAWKAPSAVEHAGYLAAGLKRLAAESFDVILLDPSLPDSHGFDTFARVREQAPQIPVILLSGMSNKELALKAVQEGAHDYLLKGQAEGDALLHAIRDAVERRPANGEQHC